jgi:pimeloyl-ACP methyl ester carboxylesterase
MISYDRRGHGEPLVLLHGIGHRWQAWQPVLPRLARWHDVISIDMPGFGGSPPPTGRWPRSMAALVAAIRDELADLGVHRPHVAGNSLGGAVALELGAAGVAASVTALAPAGFYTLGAAHRAMLILGFLRIGTYAPEPVLRRALARPWVRQLSLGELVTDPTRLDPERLVGDSVALRRGRAFWSVGWALRSYRFEGRIDVPVTVAWGTRDRLLRPWQADRARLRLPEATHVVLPRCGHVPMSDDPALVARVILQTTGALAPRQSRA